MFGKKKAEELNRVRSELDRKANLKEAYLNELKRKDGKYNFVFLPYLKIAANEYQHLYIYGRREDYGVGYISRYIAINDVMINYAHNDQLQLSLKPGKYKLTVCYDAQVNLLNNIRSTLEKQNPGVTFHTYKDLYRCEIEKTCTFVVNENDTCYVIFKGEVTPQYSRSKNLLFMDSYSHSYEMRQTSFEHIKSMIPKVWVDNDRRYKYEHVDQYWIDEAYKEYGNILRQYKDVEPKPVVTPKVESKPVYVAPKVENKTIKYPNGNEYVGDSINNVPHGFGTYYYKSGVNNGCSIVGMFTNGKINGLSTIHYKDGSYYIGDFKDNYKHGKGTLYKKDGSVEHFEYENGKLKTTTSSTSSTKPTSSSTSTYVKSTTTSSGLSSSSEIKQLGDYYGEVINNKRNGLGIRFIGTIYATIGIYKNDKLDGPYIKLDDKGIYVGLEQANLDNKFCMHTLTSFKFCDNFPYKVLCKRVFVTPEKVTLPINKETRLHKRDDLNYVGTNLLNYKEGYGIKYNVEGKTHFGQFKNGKLNGYGMIFDDKTLYIGQLEDGIYNGVGMLVNNYKSSAYTTTIGKWINGKFDS